MSDQPQDLPEIVVDSRESRSGVPAWLERLGFRTSSAEMHIGDYKAEGLFICERKTGTDFHQSLFDGRLLGQAEILASHSDRAVMIIEGGLDSVQSNVDPEAVAGALSALAMYYWMTVIPTTGPEQSARVIGRLLIHTCKGLGYQVPSRGGKPKIDGAITQYLLEGLPGVGPQTARNLVAHFGSAASVFAATVEQLQGVKGVGAKTAGTIYQALHHRPTAFRDTKGPAPARGK